MEPHLLKGLWNRKLPKAAKDWKIKSHGPEALREIQAKLLSLEREFTSDDMFCESWIPHFLMNYDWWLHQLDECWREMAEAQGKILPGQMSLF